MILDKFYKPPEPPRGIVRINWRKQEKSFQDNTQQVVDTQKLAIIIVICLE